MKIIVLVISDLSALLSKENIQKINEKEGTNYPELENTITYQMLYDSRESIGSQRGYFEKKNGIEFWVLPYLEGIVVVDETNTSIREYTEEHYKRDVLPLWDIEEIEL